MKVSELRKLLLEGQVIPAHPLALTSDRRLDERHQRALTRYYLAAGAGGLAVGVHTTQFEIHRSECGLYRPVLEMAQQEAAASRSVKGRVLLVAGLVGETRQAVAEATLARELGYHCGLLSLGSLPEVSDTELLDHCRRVAEVLPLFGFYLQPAAGGRILKYSFWKQLAELERLVAIKVAPFSRYHTLDVVRAVAESGRSSEIALYTGNDDHILLDLLTPFRFKVNGKLQTVYFAGGLLGQWAVWTRRAVELLDEVRNCVRSQQAAPRGLLRTANELTDTNAAIFDAANEFSGCISGINEVLRRQGLLAGNWCLNPEEKLSRGQAAEIERVQQAYPHLTDDEFVRQHLEEWLGG